MKFLSFALAASLAPVPIAATVAANAPAPQQQSARAQADASPAQRLDILRSRLEGMRRSLNSSIAAVNAGGDQKTEKTSGGDAANSTDARTRLRGLEREVGSVLSDVNNLRGKQERAERYDQDEIGKLETATEDLNKRVEDVLRATASERRASGVTAAAANPNAPAKKKKGGGFFGKLNPFGGGDDADKYDELVGTVAPGRDRQLFEEAARQTRKGNFEEGRLLFQTIVNTYTESPFLPLSKLAIADSFYLEGTTSNLIQAAASYREWLTFFPTHPLADDVMLKMAESEMRQMGLADRDTSHARKAEQQLKVVMQQFPETPLKADVQVRLEEVQENLALHNLQVAKFYLARYEQGKAANAKGAQNRLRETAEKYPNFSYMDEVLYNLGMTYVTEEEPDEAAKYFVRLLRDHPNSRFAEQAGEQLDLIGIARPKPDPAALQRPEAVRPGVTAKLLTEILGTVPVTVSKDGVLISKKKDGTDLIDEAIARGGEANLDRTPNPIINRRIAPAKPTAPPINRTTPSVNTINPAGTSTTSGSATTGNTSGVSIQPTPAGAPPGASNIPTQKQPPQVVNPTPTNAPATDSTTNTPTTTTPPPTTGTTPPAR